jgi:M6 family metalloprotease-like protein
VVAVIAFHRVFFEQAVLAKLICWLTVFMCVDVFATDNKKQSLLVVLVEFDDEKFDYTKADFEGLLFGAENSARSYFLKNSYNQLKIEPAVEIDGNTVLSHSMQIDHPNCEKKACEPYVKDILKAIDKEVDFKHFDDAGNGDSRLTSDELSLLFVFAGYENGVVNSLKPAVRSHKYSFDGSDQLDGVSIVSNYAILAEKIGIEMKVSGVDRVNIVSMNSLGTVVHELGHSILGLPDLYNKDANNKHPGKIPGASVDYQMWDLMAGGAAALKPKGSQPVQLSGYSKFQAGFLKPKEVVNEILMTLKPLHKQQDLRRVWLDPYKHRQYLLLEYRDDPALQYFNHQDRVAGSLAENNRPYRTQGLLVSRVDPWANNNDGKDQKLILPLLNKDGDMLSGAHAGLSGINLLNDDLVDVAINNVSLNYQLEELTFSIQVQGGETKDGLSFVDEADKLLGYYYKMNPSHFIVEMDLDNAQWVEGVDLYLANTKSVSIRLADGLMRGGMGKIALGDELYQQQFYLKQNNSGWVRLMFDRPVSVLNHQKLMLYVDVGSDGSIGYFSGDKRGTYYTDCSECGHSSIYKKRLAHDVGMRLLIDRGDVLPYEAIGLRSSILEAQKEPNVIVSEPPRPGHESDLKKDSNKKEGSQDIDSQLLSTGNKANDPKLKPQLVPDMGNRDSMDNAKDESQSDQDLPVTAQKPASSSSGGTLVLAWLLLLLPLLVRKRPRKLAFRF